MLTRFQWWDERSFVSTPGKWLLPQVERKASGMDYSLQRKFSYYHVGCIYIYLMKKGLIFVLWFNDI